MSDASDKVDLAALAAEMLGLEPEQAKLATSVIANVIRMAKTPKQPLDQEGSPANARPGDSAKRLYVWRRAITGDATARDWNGLTDRQRGEVLDDNPEISPFIATQQQWKANDFYRGK